jgi:hypothetical protein
MPVNRNAVSQSVSQQWVRAASARPGMTRCRPWSGGGDARHAPAHPGFGVAAPERRTGAGVVVVRRVVELIVGPEGSMGLSTLLTHVLRKPTVNGTRVLLWCARSASWVPTTSDAVPQVWLDVATVRQYSLILA